MFVALLTIMCLRLVGSGQPEQAAAPDLKAIYENDLGHDENNYSFSSLSAMM